MTAPGNVIILCTILAVFLGCAGYAAGRLHQWYRTGIDRDEAYREGYDTATRSTFSLAARIIGPRRDKTGIRASASVHAAGARSGTPPPGTAVQRPAAAAGRSTTPPDSGASAGQPSPVGEAARSASPPVAALPPPVETAFPAPPAYEFPHRPAPARLGAAFWSAAGTSPAEVTPAAAEQSSPAPSAPDEEAAPKPRRRGRHFVPDELVRAVTYRLAPDRVARAKVRQAKRAPEAAPDDGPTPRPRSVSEDGPAPCPDSGDGEGLRPGSRDGQGPRPVSGDGDGDGQGPRPVSEGADGSAPRPASKDRPSPRRSLPKPRAS